MCLSRSVHSSYLIFTTHGGTPEFHPISSDFLKRAKMENETSELDWSDLNTLKEHWSELDHSSRKEKFARLNRPDAEELFLSFGPLEQIELIIDLPAVEKRSWVRLLALDDAADFLQNLDPEPRQEFLALLDEVSRQEVVGLLAYAEDEAGGVMNPRYIRLRPDMSVEEAIRYLRAQARTPIETIYYTYVLDYDQKLLGVVSFRELLLASPDKRVREIMKTDLVTVPEEMDREALSDVFSSHNFMALPVVDEIGHMKGIVTYDDIVDVVQKEATEDIQKLGGMEALDAPYFKTSFLEMMKKRAGWLMVLFIGEMFTATAMAQYEHAIAKAVVLSLFIPLIISSGGNSGSQASTLIIRSLALREIRLRDWWRVFMRELSAGLVLGGILGALGLFRVYAWHLWSPVYGEHYLLIAMTVACSVLGVVLWGTLTGAMLPFLLRRVGLDPASASAPMVATIVDVTGLVIYFSMASMFLSGTLL
ncbi:MAG: magnesium transporter [Bdellovibrionales bacterium]|nr:magnesium transporter [Bdellovibrionales bacterium]